MAAGCRHGVWTPMSTPRPAARLEKPPLISQVLAVNAALLCGTILAAIVVASDMSSPEDRRRFLVLVAAGLGAVLVNGVVLRRRFEPLERLIAAMEAVDFGPDGGRPAWPQADSEEVA